VNRRPPSRPPNRPSGSRPSASRPPTPRSSDTRSTSAEAPRTASSKPPRSKPEPSSREFAKPAPAKPAPGKPASSKPPYAKPPIAKSAITKPGVTAASTADRPPRPAHLQPLKDGSLWLYGSHAVLAALGNPSRRIRRVLATEDTAASLPDGTEVHIVKREELARLLPDGAVHQGLAVAAMPLPPTHLDQIVERVEREAPKRAIVMVLDQVTDPQNIGAVLRSAAAFGALALVLPDRGAPEVTGVVAKAASGAVEHVPIIRVVNLTHALDELKQAGFWSVGLAGDADKTLAELNLSGRVVLVLGSEGEGLRRLTRERCDLLARLPTGGPIATLNVSNAAAVALYELVRGP
jgi:23S rRNA (guanosine2251-2'-O)-methyltransferase